MTQNNSIDLTIPGVIYSLDPNEADELGAFVEDAISEEDAKESDIDEHTFEVNHD